MSPRNIGESKAGNDPWTAEHDQALARAIIQLLLTSRRALYSAPGLAGSVDGHGGNRISQKVITHCERLAEAAGLGKRAVGDIKEAMGAKRKRTGVEGDCLGSSEGGASEGASAGASLGKKVRETKKGVATKGGGGVKLESREPGRG